MDNKQAGDIFLNGTLIEENKGNHYRIWPRTIDGRWLYPGEKIIEHKGTRYVVTMPEEAKSKFLD